MMTHVIAHRGAPAEAPENTLASFRLGLEAGGDVLELDIRTTRDGRLAVIHDATVDRTTHGTGEVAALTWDELRTLTANRGYEGFATERIPSLDEVIALASPDTIVNIEIKNAKPDDLITAQTLVEWIVQESIPLERLLISCFDAPALHSIAGQLPRVALAIPFKVDPGNLAAIPFGTLHPRHNLVDAAFMDRARAAQKRVNVWTVDDPTEQERLILLGVDGIMTNDPRSMRHLLDTMI